MRHYEMVPLSPLQVLNGQILHQALTEASQSTVHRIVAVDGLAALRREQPLEPDVPVDPILLRAVALTLAEHPWMNAHLVDRELCQYHTVTFGVVLARNDGLVAPTIRDAGTKSVEQLKAELQKLAEVATQGVYSFRDMQKATFMIANLGRYGVDFFEPILPPGPVAILGLNRMRRVCHPVNEQCRAVDVMPLSLTFDHRAINGVRAAQFITALEERLARPEAL